MYCRNRAYDSLKSKYAFHGGATSRRIGLQHRDEPLVAQVLHLPVEAPEERGHDAVVVRQPFAPRHHLERAVAALVVHRLRGGLVARHHDPERLPRVAVVDALPVGVGGRVLVRRPRRERRDHAHRVEALPLAQRHGLLERDARRRPGSPGRPARPVSGSRHVAAPSQVSPSRKNGVPSAYCSAWPFAVRPQEAAPVRVLPLLRLGPVHGP